MACETGYIIERVETNLIKFADKEGDPVPAALHLDINVFLIQISEGQGPLPNLIICKLSVLSEEGFKLLECRQSWPCTQGGTLHRSHSIS